MNATDLMLRVGVVTVGALALLGVVRLLTLAWERADRVAAQAEPRDWLTEDDDDDLHPLGVG